MVIVLKVFNLILDFSSHQVYCQVQTNFKKSKKALLGTALAGLMVSVGSVKFS